MANKKLIWLAVGSALLIGGGVFWWMKTRPTGEQLADKKSASEDATETGGTKTTSKPSLPPSPFKSQAEGDTFRGWMAKTHPDFRYEGQVLDPTGSYTNAFITTAYKQYGAEYLKAFNASSSKPASAPSSSSSFSSGDNVYLNTDSTMLYSYPQNNATYVLGQVARKIFTDKPIGTYVSDAGNGFIKINPIGYTTFDPSSNDYTTVVSGAGKTAYVNKALVGKTV